MEIIVGIMVGLLALNLLSYRILKPRLIKQQQWDLNICCGNTSVGRVNADIVAQPGVNNFMLIPNIYQLPFKDGEFDEVLCSHTLEHVEDPQAFWDELNRVGKRVTLILPPLWDVAAVFNIFEHRWIFLTFKKAHTTLPRYIRFTFAHYYQERFGHVVANSLWQRLLKSGSNA